MIRPTIDEVWLRISAHQGERFETISGRPFSYTVSAGRLVTDRTSFPLSFRDFETALDLVPCAGPGEITRVVRGPSYIWAILHDARVRQADW